MPKRHFLRMPKFPTRPGPSPDLDRNRFSGPDNTGKLRKGQRQPGHGMFMVGLQHKKTLIRTRPQTIVFQRLHKGLQPPIMWNGRAWAHGIMGWRHTQWCCFYTVTLNHDHPASSSLCYGQHFALVAAMTAMQRSDRGQSLGRSQEDSRRLNTPFHKSPWSGGINHAQMADVFVF